MRASKTLNVNVPVLPVKTSVDLNVLCADLCSVDVDLSNDDEKCNVVFKNHPLSNFCPRNYDIIHKYYENYYTYDLHHGISVCNTEGNNDANFCKTNIATFESNELNTDIYKENIFDSIKLGNNALYKNEKNVDLNFSNTNECSDIAATIDNYETKEFCNTQENDNSNSYNFNCINVVATFDDCEINADNS